VRVISGARFHFEQPGAATVSDGQLLVTTDAGASGAISVINAATGAITEVLDRSSCQFAAPSALTADGNAAFVTSEAGGVTEVRSGNCVAADEGSRYGFHSPGASTVADGRFFVANEPSGSAGRGSITELDASTGTLSRVVTEPADLSGFVVAVAAEGNHVYVVGGLDEVAVLNTGTGAVARHFKLPFEALATGAVLEGATLYMSVAQGGLLALNTNTGRVRQLVGEPSSESEFSVSIGLPSPMVFRGEDLFYLAPNSSGTASLEEVDTATGKLVRVIAGASYHLEAFSQVAAWGDDLFVADPGFFITVTDGAAPAGTSLSAVSKPPTGSLTEIDATTGALVRRISGARYDFQAPEGITAAGDDLFVADSGASAVTELDARTGRLVRVMSGAQYHFDSPQGLAVYGGHLFVVNPLGDSITDINLGS
jgi:hypothetical protein